MLKVRAGVQRMFFAWNTKIQFPDEQRKQIGILMLSVIDTILSIAQTTDLLLKEDTRIRLNVA